MRVILRLVSPRQLALFNSLFFSLYAAMDKAKVSSMIANSNKGLISQFKTLIIDSFSDLKRSNGATASQQMQEIKRIKCDPVPQFNKKSNEDQFKANKAVTEAVEDAQASLRTKDLEIRKEALDRGMALLQERQKLTLLADNSPYGWKTVFEYKHHDIAEDEEDEKNIHRAESRASRAVKRSASRTSQHKRKSLLAVQAKSPQLAASQSPNLFSPVNHLLLVLVLRGQTRSLECLLSLSAAI